MYTRLKTSFVNPVLCNASWPPYKKFRFKYISPKSIEHLFPLYITVNNISFLLHSILSNLVIKTAQKQEILKWTFFYIRFLKLGKNKNKWHHVRVPAKKAYLFIFLLINSFSVLKPWSNWLSIQPREGLWLSGNNKTACRKQSVFCNGIRYHGCMELKDKQVQQIHTFKVSYRPNQPRKLVTGSWGCSKNSYFLHSFWSECVVLCT